MLEQAGRSARALSRIDFAVADLTTVRNLVSGDVALGRMKMVEVYRTVPGDPGPVVAPVLDIASPTLPPGASRASAERLAQQVVPRDLAIVLGLEQQLRVGVADTVLLVAGFSVAYRQDDRRHVVADSVMHVAY